ncbi:phage tail P2-like protein [Stackebrandtia albiflava]|uniref:Phage tail P2-like protein n=1 Tax=Stackebrandtia albiflava TaxID=406432 RepID=A0A562UPY2_9ACTN|nr:phage tail protein I [Stackebrandtia albiflava]TWJ07656.1 phage tail P2-like protein [Stackebrandtia albiflava]
MRGAIPGLPTPHPLSARLPSVYLGDDFTTRFTEAFDEVLAPLFTVLDCLPQYFDPALCPPDFLEWLAGWVAFPLDGAWDDARRREVVGNAVELHRWRGTSRGLAAQVRLMTGGEVEVVDSGGCTWSREPGADPPGDQLPGVEVRVRPAPGSRVHPERLRAAILDAVPAHVPVRVRIVAHGRAEVPGPPS